MLYSFTHPIFMGLQLSASSLVGARTTVVVVGGWRGQTEEAAE